MLRCKNSYLGFLKVPRKKGFSSFIVVCITFAVTNDISCIAVFNFGQSKIKN